MQTQPAAPQATRVLIRRKASALGTSAVGGLWWVVLFIGLYFYLEPSRAYEPLGMGLIALTFPLLLVFDLMHTAVLVDPARSVVKSWRGHVIPWGLRNTPFSEIDHIGLSTVTETHRVRQTTASSQAYSYKSFRVDVVTIAIVTRSGASIIVERSSLVQLLQEQLLAISRALPVEVRGSRVPEASLKQVWARRFARRGVPGVLLLLAGLAMGGTFVLMSFKTLELEKVLPWMVMAPIMTLGGFWLAWTGCFLPSSLRRTARPKEVSGARYVVAGLAVILCGASLLATAGTAAAQLVAGQAARAAAKSPGLDKLDKEQIGQLMMAFGYKYRDDCVPPDFWDGCAGEWEKKHVGTTVYLVDLAERASEEPARVYQLAPDRMIEVTVTGAPRAVASSLLAAIGPAKDSSAIEKALKKAGYDRVKTETDYPSNRELRTTAESSKETVKVVVRVSDLSQYQAGTKAVTSSKLLRLYGGDAQEMLPVLMGKK